MPVANAVFQPITVGAVRLGHRFAMAPMTRSRAQADGTPGPLAAEYYAQRASLGLLISEGVQPSADGQGYMATPGIFTTDHARGWRKVTDAVHAAGGRLFIQLMHVGRMSHPDNTPHHRQAVAPSAIAPKAPMFTASGMQPIPTPRALSVEEIEETIQEFRRAAAQAIAAGADGVEIHGANGYLIQQFLAPNASVRTDRYGGPIDDRIAFALQVAAAIAAEIGPERVGFRISPGSKLADIEEGPDGPALYRALVSELARLNLAYQHVVQAADEQLLFDIRSLWPTALIVNRPNRLIGNLEDDISNGVADMVSLVRLALANPDFVERYRRGGPYNDADPAKFYGGGAAGYIDYPTLQPQSAAMVA